MAAEFVFRKTKNGPVLTENLNSSNNSQKEEAAPIQGRGVKKVFGQKAVAAKEPVPNEAVEQPVVENAPVEEVANTKVYREGDELTEEEVQAVIHAESIENAIRLQLGSVELDVPVPETPEQAIRLRDNSRQAFKENEIRLRNTLQELMKNRERLEIAPNDEIQLEYKVQLEGLCRKYISKMRKYLKRYEVAKEIAQRHRETAMSALQAVAESLAENVQAEQKQQEVQSSEASQA